MSFDLQRILESKRAFRQRLTARPIAEKLRMLDELRARAMSLRGATACSRSLKSQSNMNTMHWKARIVIDPQILAGKPVIRGTRLAVDFTLGLLAQAWSEADIKRNYPGISHDDIAACLEYASEVF